jgi:hypothetical protein
MTTINVSHVTNMRNLFADKIINIIINHNVLNTYIINI